MNSDKLSRCTSVNGFHEEGMENKKIFTQANPNMGRIVARSRNSNVHILIHTSSFKIRSNQRISHCEGFLVDNYYTKVLSVFNHDIIHIFDAKRPIQTTKQTVSIAIIRAATLQQSP